MILTISKGETKKAIQECSKQVEKAPRDKRLRLKLGDLYLKNGDDEKAIKEYLQTGELYANEDLNAKAIAVYRRVLSIDPKHIGVIHKMATLYLKEGLLGDARGCYEKILRIRPGDQEALKGLSMIRESQQPKQAQIKGQEKGSASEILPEDPNIPFHSMDLETHYHLGIGYKEMGLLEYAIAELELASEDPLMKFECYMLLGECFKQKGDSEESMKYFGLASKIRELPKDLRLDSTKPIAS